MNNILIAVVAVVVVVAGGYYAWQSSLLDFDYQAPVQESAQELTPLAPGTIEEELIEKVVIEEEVVEEVTGTPIEGHKNTVEDFKKEVRLCESDADCKIQSIGCNGCDCGRAVNNWIEPVCTGEEENVCPDLVCPASKAVCNSGVCEKIEL